MITKSQNKKGRFIAVGLAVILIASIFIPKFVNAMMIYALWDNPAVAPTWTSAPDEWLARQTLDKYKEYKKTGLAMNTNFYFGVNKAGFAWPLGGQMYVEERPGYDNTGYENFNLRHTFCTGNHESAVGITPGARAYHSGTYWYTDDLAHMFEEAKKGKIKFNFLMMALGCYYPGDYTINKNAGSIAEDSAAAQAVVSQLIAWVCTDNGSPGFTGDWPTDFNTFHKWGGYYNLMMSSMFQANDPVIYNALHAAPSPTSGAGIDGMPTMADAWFWDIWTAANVSQVLEANWDKEISQYNTALKQKDLITVFSLVTEKPKSLPPRSPVATDFLPLFCNKENLRCKEKTLDTRPIFQYDNQGDVMESIVKQSLLYDFYGELLTEHQRTVYEDVVFNDMSLGEIAEEQGISRQGVHDLIKRCDRILGGYEEKLHLISKFQQTRAMVGEIQELTKRFFDTRDAELIHQIEKISSDIIEL